jgi:diguanylate cyclase (GGDEF)-like protein/PAS domain S-box-containing protein
MPMYKVVRFLGRSTPVRSARWCERGAVRPEDSMHEVSMTDRTELLEAALDSFPDGVALISGEDGVVFWNRAAQEILGYTSMDLVERPMPTGLEPLLRDGKQPGDPQLGHGALVQARHKLGHVVQAIARTRVLRDDPGERIGAAVVFHPAESLEALPHGKSEEDGEENSEAEFEERLENEFEDCARNGLPFGVLWIGVDQAEELRKTHGAPACHEMLKKMAHALAVGLRPAEEMARWGDSEFLIIAHERTPDMLHAHARVLAGLARTAEFHWWGDHISLTVSLGAAQADAEETLAQLLERAQRAMVQSMQAGGNQATSAPTSALGRQPCSSS